jgi:hypothetical protein
MNYYEIDLNVIYEKIPCEINRIEIIKEEIAMSKFLDLFEL